MLLYVYLIVLSNRYAQLIQCKNIGSVSRSKVKNKTSLLIHKETLLPTLTDVTYRVQANTRREQYEKKSLIKLLFGLKVV